jgi:long-chain fatty acid transport protein
MAFFMSLTSLATAHGGGFESPGVGAKAMAMGGAFVGLADDWTATYWNPAGLAQLTQSGVGVAVNVVKSRELDGDSINNPFPPFTQQNIERGDPFINLGGQPTHFNATTSKMLIPIPATGAYMRRGRWVGAFSVHTPLGFSSEVMDTSVPGLSADFKTRGYIIMSGFSIATELTSAVAVGAGIHLLTGRLERHATKISATETQQSDTTASGLAPEGIVGALIKVLPNVRMGLVYRTPATMHFSGSASVSDNGGPFAPEASDFKRDVANPATYGAGLAWNPHPRWTLTGDWQGTDWRSTREHMTFDQPGVLLQNTDFDPRWRFTHRVRFGLQFKPQEAWSFRAGFFNDPQALQDQAQSITGLIDVTRQFWTLGAGWTGTSLGANIAYLYSHGQRTLSGVDFSQEAHSFLVDLEYHFKS